MAKEERNWFTKKGKRITTPHEIFLTDPETEEPDDRGALEGKDEEKEKKTKKMTACVQEIDDLRGRKGLSSLCDAPKKSPVLDLLLLLLVSRLLVVLLRSYRLTQGRRKKNRGRKKDKSKGARRTYILMVDEAR